MVLTTRGPRPAPRGWSLFVSLALVAASVLALSLGGQRDATVADFLRRTPVADRDLLVGVFDDQPPLGSVDSRGRRVGFDVELAAALARSLGVRPVYVTLAPQERLRALVERRVDVVFAGLLMTAERRRIIDFAGPYLAGDVVALAPRTWSGRLAGARVCTVEGATVNDLLASRQVILTLRPRQRDCVADVRSGRLDAVVGDEITLRGQAGAALRVFPIGPGLPEQRYGIGVTPGDRYLRALVDSFLLASYAKREAGAWQRAADRTLVPAGYARRQPSPEGTLLRGAGDGEPMTGAAVLPPAVVPAARTPARRRTLRRRGNAPERRPWPPRRAAAAPPERPVAATAAVDRSQAWSLLLGVPVAVSALYLWIQSGGDRQFTLMLADSVNPITFLATVSLSVVWIFFTVPAVVCTVGAVVLASAADAADRRALCRRHPVARWTARTPPWVIGLSVLTAALSTPLVLVPAWGFALHLAVRPAAGRWRPPVAALLLAVPAGVLAWAAGREGEVALVLIAGWPVAALLLAGAGTVRRAAVAGFVRACGALAAVLAVGVLYAVVTTPILPSTAVQVARPVAPSASGAPAADPDTAAGGTAVRQVRGYVVSVDGETTTILSDLGGVEILPNADIVSRISCPSFTDLPGDSAALAGLPLRESLLKALARRQRPAALQDPRCVVRPDPGTP